jgi:aspartyl-tRNA(Asn)/glutamyl-tRNA(Gln) amidotransferase subunit B
MEEGSLRCDANVSLRPRGREELGVKTELKNMNSFNSVERALETEIKRQAAILDDGAQVTQQTLLWNADRNAVEAMRSKEESHDYRYFPEPDLVPVTVDADWIDRIAQTMPEMPDAKKDRFIREYGIPDYDASVLTEDAALGCYFEIVAANVADKKVASNWVMGEVLRALKEEHCQVNELKVTAVDLAEIIGMIEDGLLNRNLAKTVFDEGVKSGMRPREIVEKGDMIQISDSDALESAVTRVLEAHPAEVKAYLGGKEKLIGFFIGKVMRETSGKANPKTLNELLRKKLATLK